jgi:N6-adenosine-specific RNA methylase IME4
MGKISHLLQDKSQRTVAFDLNAGHSIKPPRLQERLEMMFPTTDKVELFARRPRPGWEVLGNEVQGGLDIIPAIDALAKQV